MTKRDLGIRGALDWTKGECEKLVNFLNEHKDLPIVAHNESYDHWKVLKPAFEKVGKLEALPKTDRWRCTQKLAQQKLVQDAYFLDAVLESCGYDARDEDEPHEAGTDALLAARVYMHLVQIPEPYKSHLGFLTEPDPENQMNKTTVEK